MFGSGPVQLTNTGKKMQGFQSRKQGEFSLGWETSDQMNEYQTRKSKKFEPTGKINQEYAPKVQKTNVQPTYQQAYYDEPTSQIEQQQQQQKLQEYERLLREYPDIPAEEIKRIVMGGQQQQPLRQQQQPQKQSSSYQQSQKYHPQSIPVPLSSQNKTQMRTPVRPRDSMKGIIFGGQIGSQNENPHRAYSRRNNSNLILGDGFNHFKANY